MKEKLKLLQDRIQICKVSACNEGFDGFGYDFEEIHQDLCHFLSDDTIKLVFELDGLIGQEDLTYKLEDLIHDIKK